MKKRIVPMIILIAYVIILVKVIVLKDIPVIRIGSLLLNFGGTNGGHPANFIPFTTIVPYLMGDKGLIIAGINLVGNIALLIPLGFLVPFVYKAMTWKKSLILGLIAGFTIEILQAILRVGIFDIDDMILNALGVLIGYALCVILMRWIQLKKYNYIIITVLISLIALGTVYALFPKYQQPVTTEVGAGNDLCGGTGGTGEIVAIGKNTITIRGGDMTDQIITLTDTTTIRTSMGPASQDDLKKGDRVTIVMYDNNVATTVLVCTTAN